MANAADATGKLRELFQLENLGIVSETLQKLALASVVVTLIFALLQCFFGYKLLRAWITFVGFLIGFFLGMIISGALGASGYVPVIVGIIAGILIALLAFKIYLVGVFLYCGTIAAAATRLIPFPEGKGWVAVSFVIAVAAFLIAGFLAVKFAKPCIIGITAISGACTAVQAIQELSVEFATSDKAPLLALAGLIAAGVLVQVLTTRGKK